jgi:hypothetical protein
MRFLPDGIETDRELVTSLTLPEFDQWPEEGSESWVAVVHAAT